MKDSQTTPIQAANRMQPRTPKVKELLIQNKSVILATVNEEGIPNASYAPYVRMGNNFYILVSFMAVHTKNLRDIQKASAMFIEDENVVKQIFARDRLTLDVHCIQIERNTIEWNDGVVALKEVHGKILDVLTSMEDFIMIKLIPIKGAYVNGFGSAYYVDKNLEITEHRNDVAHLTTKDN